jgi:putative transposase
MDNEQYVSPYKLTKQLEDGLKKEKLDALGLTMEKESIISLTSSLTLGLHHNQKQNIPSATQELVPITKKKTLLDKLIYLKANTLMQKLSKTLVLDSILTDKDLDPFWNLHTLEMSQKLWLPTKTDCVDLEANSLNLSSKKLMLNSWFSTQLLTSKMPLQNYQKIFLQSLQSLLQKTMDSEQLITENKDKLQKAKKIATAHKKILKAQEMYELLSSDEKLQADQKQQIKDQKVLKKEQKKLDKINKEKQKCLKSGKEYKEPEIKNDAEKAIRIKIYPTTEQKHILRQWFGIRRYIYNKCVERYNITKKFDLLEYRKNIINNENFIKENQWMLAYEYDLRDEAVRDFKKNLSSNYAKGKFFQIKFKSKKIKTTESISVLSKKWNKPNNFYSNVFKPNVLKSSEDLPDDLKYSSRLLHTRTNKYFLCIPKPLELQNENQVHNKYIFIDPGQVDFVTGYDPSGQILIWGKNDHVRISRLLHSRKKLISKRDKETRKLNKKRQSLAILRLYEKINNLVTEMHKKLALWLCQNYNKIYIPRLNFHTMKNLNKRSKSILSSLKHCEFVNRLINKSREFADCEVIEVNESFTSKTCGSCGFQKSNLGRNRIYNCDSCKSVIGRDINASRNIMLRYFSKIFKVKFE